MEDITCSWLSPGQALAPCSPLRCVLDIARPCRHLFISWNLLRRASFDTGFLGDNPLQEALFQLGSASAFDHGEASSKPFLVQTPAEAS